MKRFLIIYILFLFILMSCGIDISNKLLVEHVTPDYDFYVYDFQKRKMHPFLFEVNGKQGEIWDHIQIVPGELYTVKSKKMQLCNEKQELYLYITVRSRGRWDFSLYIFDLSSHALKRKIVLDCKGYEFFLSDDELYYTFESNSVTTIYRMNIETGYIEAIMQTEYPVTRLVHYENLLIIQHQILAESVFDLIFKTVKYDLVTHQEELVSATEFYYSDLLKAIIYADNEYTGVTVEYLQGKKSQFVKVKDIDSTTEFCLADENHLVLRRLLKAGDRFNPLSTGMISIVNIDTMEEKRVMKSIYHGMPRVYLDVFDLSTE